MKKVSLKDVNNGKWKTKKGDRSTLNTAMAAVSTTEAVNRMVEIAEINTDFLRNMEKAVNKFLARTPQVPAIAAQPAKPVQVTVTPDHGKKKFRFNIIRNSDGFIDTIEVEQI